MVHSDRLFVSLASASRLSAGDYGRTRAGRVSILDLKTWAIERVLVDDSDNYVTCLTVHPDRQLLILGSFSRVRSLRSPSPSSRFDCCQVSAMAKSCSTMFVRIPSLTRDSSILDLFKTSTSSAMTCTRSAMTTRLFNRTSHRSINSCKPTSYPIQRWDRSKRLACPRPAKVLLSRRRLTLACQQPRRRSPAPTVCFPWVTCSIEIHTIQIDSLRAAQRTRASIVYRSPTKILNFTSQANPTVRLNRSTRCSLTPVCIGIETGIRAWWPVPMGAFNFIVERTDSICDSSPRCDYDL